MPWNTLQTEIVPDDLLIKPLVGSGGMTREQAHAEIQGLLDRSPDLASLAATWRAGAKDDTVFGGLFAWTIYEYSDDIERGAAVWLDEYATTMRGAGLDVQVAQ